MVDCFFAVCFLKKAFSISCFPLLKVWHKECKLFETSNLVSALAYYEHAVLKSMIGCLELPTTTPRAYFTTIFEFYYAWNYANRKLRRAKFRSKICFSAQFRSKDNVTTGSFGCSAQDYGFSVSCYGGANIYRYSACVISQNRGWFWLVCFWLPLQNTDSFFFAKLDGLKLDH